MRETLSAGCAAWTRGTEQTLVLAVLLSSVASLTYKVWPYAISLVVVGLALLLQAGWAEPELCSIANGAWPTVHGLWCMAYGAWPMVHGLWLTAYGAWPMVHGL